MKFISKNKYWDLLIKGVIITLLSYTLYRQIFSKEDIALLWESFLENFSTARFSYLFWVLLLMPINWGLEALKWYLLTRKHLPISYFQLYKAVLSGVTISLFTPNRVGEYGGRILLIDAKYNWPSFIAAMVGSFAQMLILIAGGIFGLVFFTYYFLDWEWYLLESFMILGIFLVVTMTVFYFNIDLLLILIKRLPKSEKLNKFLTHFNTLKNYPAKTLFQVLLVAFLRYSTYTSQYYLILLFYNLNFPIIPAVCGIVSIFLFQTSVPLPPVMGLMARGELALFIWSAFESNEISILAATFTLFIINLSIPAFIGLIYIAKTNILKSLGYEKKTI